MPSQEYRCCKECDNIDIVYTDKPTNRYCSVSHGQNVYFCKQHIVRKTDEGWEICDGCKKSPHIFVQYKG